MIRQIRSLLYEQGYTIGGARLQLTDVQKEDGHISKETLQALRQELEEIAQILKI